MKSCYRVRWLYIFLVGLLALLFLAYFFQWAALLSILPWLFILACPLMHLMGGHGGHIHDSRSHNKSKETVAK